MRKTKAELEFDDRVLMREQDDRGRIALAVRRAKESVSGEVAQRLLEAGFSAAEVAGHTGLPLAEVGKINVQRQL